VGRGGVRGQRGFVRKRRLRRDEHARLKDQHK
jgi:hypothetical protein